eukprot:g1090.t1
MTHLVNPAQKKQWPLTWNVLVSKEHGDCQSSINAIAANNNSLTHISLRLAEALKLDYDLNEKVLLTNSLGMGGPFSAWESKSPMLVSIKRSDHGADRSGGNSSERATCKCYPIILEEAYWEMTLGQDIFVQLNECIIDVKEIIPTFGPKYDAAAMWWGHNMCRVSSLKDDPAAQEHNIDFDTTESSACERIVINLAKSLLYCKYKSNDSSTPWYRYDDVPKKILLFLLTPGLNISSGFLMSEIKKRSTAFHKIDDLNSTLLPPLFEGENGKVKLRLIPPTAWTGKKHRRLKCSDAALISFFNKKWNNVMNVETIHISTTSQLLSTMDRIKKCADPSKRYRLHLDKGQYTTQTAIDFPADKIIKITGKGMGRSQWDDRPKEWNVPEFEEEKKLRFPSDATSNSRKRKHILQYTKQELQNLGWDGSTYFSRSQGGRSAPYIQGYDSDSDYEYDDLITVPEYLLPSTWKGGASSPQQSSELPCTCINAPVKIINSCASTKHDGKLKYDCEISNIQFGNEFIIDSKKKLKLEKVSVQSSHGGDAIEIKNGNVYMYDCEVIGGSDGVYNKSSVHMKFCIVRYAESRGIFNQGSFTFEDSEVSACGGYGMKLRMPVIKLGHNIIQPGPWDNSKVRSRAFFKLEQIDRKLKILQSQPSTSPLIVIDLGAAPGSWSQYILQNSFHKFNKRIKAQNNIPPPFMVVGVDLLHLKPFTVDEIHVIQEKKKKKKKKKKRQKDIKDLQTPARRHDVNVLETTIDRPPLLDDNAINNVFHFFKGDFTSIEIQNNIIAKIEDFCTKHNELNPTCKSCNLIVLSDMAPNLSGNATSDSGRMVSLSIEVLDFVDVLLQTDLSEEKENATDKKPLFSKTSLLMKTFQGAANDEDFRLRLRNQSQDYSEPTLFPNPSTVKYIKPPASRSGSGEKYLYCSM